MRHWTRNVGLVLCPALLLSLTLVGCSGKEDIKVNKRNDRRQQDDKDGKEKTDDKPDDKAAAGTLTPIKGTGTGTLKGTIKLAKGDEPDFKALTDSLLTEINKADSKAHCLKGGNKPGKDPETAQFTWLVDKESSGVKNVFVWLRPEDENKQFFDVAAMVKEGKGFDKFKVIDQPHCAFEPHAMILFPRYVDPAKPSRNFRISGTQAGPPATGQEFKVKNSAPIAHNTDWSGQSTAGGSKGVPPGGGEQPILDIRPFYKEPVALKCSVHPWMKAYVWAFDHPFAALTNEKGEYEIKGIPTGVKLRVVAWHEGAGWVNGGEKGEEITLQDGDKNPKDFAVKYSK